MKKFRKFILWLGFVGMLVLWLVVFILPSVFEKTEYKTNGEWIKVRKGTVVSTKILNEDYSYPLNAGDSVRLLGYKFATLTSGCLVETSSGVRGEIQMWMLDVPMLASWGNYCGDTVRLNYPSGLEKEDGRMILTKKGKITGVLSNGEKTDNLVSGDFYPDVPDVFRLKLGNIAGFTTLMSKSKFEKRMKNLDLNSAERMIGPIIFQARKGNGEVVSMFRTHVFDPKDGKFYRPYVTFSADSIAVSSQFQLTGANSDWILRYIPGASWFFDMPITAFFARSDVYNPLVNPKGYITEFETILYWVVWVLKKILFVVWLFCFGFIPIRLIDFIIVNCPKVFSFASNKAMSICYLVLPIVLYYFWLMVTLAWGLYWLLAIVEVIVVGFIIIGSYVYFGSKFWNVIPHTRCPNCKHIHTIELVSREFKRSDIDVEDTTDTSVIGEDKKRWKEYTEVHQGGRVWNENERIHTETTIHERHDKYKDTFRRDRYDARYKCTVCGYKERQIETDSTRIGREYKGSKKTSRKEFDTEYK